MPNLKKVADNSTFQKFLVRFKDKEVIELTQKALDRGLFSDRNALINEAVRSFLRTLFEKEGGDIAIRQIIKEELKSSVGLLKNDLNYLSKTVEFLSIIQNSDDKLITRLFNYFIYFIQNNENILPINIAEIESGILDNLPDDLLIQRNDLLKKTIR